MEQTYHVRVSKKEVWICILLSVLTLGIYLYYWQYRLLKNIKELKKDYSPYTGEMLCLIFLPFYSLYWWYTRGRAVSDELAKHDCRTLGNGYLYLGLAIVGLGVVAAAIMQNDFNESGLLPVKESSLRKSKWYTVLLFLLPALILFVGILIAPIVISAYDSLFSFKSFADPNREFVGLGNYVTLFTPSLTSETGNVLPNPRYMGDALVNTLILAALSVFIQLPLALAIALKLGKGIKGERPYLTVFFMPVLISTVIIGQLWLKIYDSGSAGVLNAGLKALGIDTWLFPWIKEQVGSKWPFTGQWLGYKSTALIASFIPVLWQYVGYHMLLMYAGIKGVPADLLEAARLDGATEGQISRHIIIPYIKPILKVSVIFAVTGSLKSFDLFHAMFGRDNDPKVLVPSTLLYNQTFLNNQFGLGSAIATILIVLCFAFAILISAAFRNKGDKVA